MSVTRKITKCPNAEALPNDIAHDNVHCRDEEGNCYHIPPENLKQREDGVVEFEGSLPGTPLRVIGEFTPPPPGGTPRGFVTITSGVSTITT